MKSALRLLESAIITLVIGGSIAGTFYYFFRDTPRYFIPGIIEAEDMTVLVKSPGLKFEHRGGYSVRGNRWSRDGYMFANAKSKGAFIRLVFVARRQTKYRAVLYAASAPTFGIVDVRINGNPGNNINLYSGIPEVIGPVDLGVHTFSARRNTLSVKVIGNDPSADATYNEFGIDGLVLYPLN